MTIVFVLVRDIIQGSLHRMCSILITFRSAASVHLSFIYVPQVIVSLTLTGVYTNPNSYYSGMSSAVLHA